MKGLKCLFKNLTIRRLFLVFALPVSLFGSLCLSSSASAFSWAYSADTVGFDQSNGGITEATFTNAGSYDYRINANSRVSRIYIRFNNSSFNNHVKPNLTGRQYFTISFAAIVNDSYLPFNSATLSSTGDGSNPVLTSFVVSPSCVSDTEFVYGYNPDSNTFYYPSGNNHVLADQCYYHISAQGYVDDSDKWNGVIAFGGVVLSNSDSVGRYVTIFRPSITLYDTELQSTNNAINEQTAQDKQYHDEEQQGLEDAKNDAQSGADDSGAEAESSGSTLLQAFIDFVNALTGASATNCTINADIGDFKMGNVDLCQLNPPPAFQVITSIMVIGFTVPLSIALGKKMISLFRSFQT